MRSALVGVDESLGARLAVEEAAARVGASGRLVLAHALRTPVVAEQLPGALPARCRASPPRSAAGSPLRSSNGWPATLRSPGRAAWSTVSLRSRDPARRRGGRRRGRARPARAGRLKVVKVDVDREPGPAERFGVNGVPLLVLLRDGLEVARQGGALPPARPAARLDGRLADARA